MAPQRKFPSHITICAGDSLYGAGLALSAVTGVERVNHLFPELFSAQNDIRLSFGWRRAEQTVFTAAVDLASERQSGLLKKAEEAGALVDSVDYRDYYASIALGGAPVGGAVPSDSEDTGDSSARPRPSLASRISFLLGGIAARCETSPAQVLLIAHHFELKDSLLELHRRGAQVAVAFYRSLMDPRWERIGLFADGDRCPIRFRDLGEYVDNITTLGPRRHRAPDASASRASTQLF